MRVLALLCCAAVGLTAAMTPIHVTNAWRKEVNVKIHGEGVGGCDIILDKNTTSQSDCACLWGTVGYKFSVWSPSAATSGPHAASRQARSQELPLCSDDKSLGNCYHMGSYHCYVIDTGPLTGPLCHCNTSG